MYIPFQLEIMYATGLQFCCLSEKFNLVSLFVRDDTDNKQLYGDS